MYKFLRLLLVIAILTTWYSLNIIVVYKIFGYSTILGLMLTLIFLIINVGVLEAIKKENEKMNEVSEDDKT